MLRQSRISCQFHVRKTPLCVAEYQLPRVNNSDIKQKGMKYFAAESDNYSNHSRSNSGLNHVHKMLSTYSQLQRKNYCKS